MSTFAGIDWFALDVSGPRLFYVLYCAVTVLLLIYALARDTER